MWAAAGRVWTWLDPGNLSRLRLGGLGRRVWRGWGDPGVRETPADEFWEAREDVSGPAEYQRAGAPREVGPGEEARWSRVIRWFRAGPREAGEPRDGEASDYGTPPPSPPPRPPRRSWPAEVLPEHFDICFNLLRHLFDLLVVGLLRAASAPTRLALGALGVRGALELWLHGMAMFLVSTVGMAGLLWVVRECLPQVALAYGVVQALVISVSVRQGVILGEGEEEEEEGGDRDPMDEAEEEWEWDRPGGVVRKTEPTS